MSADTDTRLIYMVNQISRNFEAIGHDHAIAATLDHILAYWEPRMKARIVELAGARPDALSGIGAAAIDRLRAGIEPASQTRATRFAAVDDAGGSDAG